MKLHFTRKTWYFFMLAAAAAGMADGFAMLAGQDYSFLEMLSFAACGIAVLFLAAEKPPVRDPALAARRHGRNPGPWSGPLFGCFVALLVSYILFGSHMAMRLTLFWPLWVWVEYRRGGRVGPQLRLLVFAEVMQAALLLAVNGGVASLQWLAMLFWILLCLARGWAALVLYRQKDNDTTD